MNKSINILRLSLALAFVFVMSCNRNDIIIPNNYSDALYVEAGAKSIEYQKLYGSDQLYYKIIIDYPANTLINNIGVHLKSRGWEKLEYDYLNPGIPSSHVSGWSDFEDISTEHPKVVYHWLAQWINVHGDIVVYSLKYSWQRNGVPYKQLLSAVAIYLPASIVKLQKEEAFRINKIN